MQPGLPSKEGLKAYVVQEAANRRRQLYCTVVQIIWVFPKPTQSEFDNCTIFYTLLYRPTSHRSTPVLSSQFVLHVSTADLSQFDSCSTRLSFIATRVVGTYNCHVVIFIFILFYFFVADFRHFAEDIYIYISSVGISLFFGKRNWQ